MHSVLPALAWALLSATQVLASCAYGTHLHRRTEGQVEVNNFGYVGVTGPTNWVALDPAANALCAMGSNQSPIDMVEGQFQLVPASALNIAIPDFAEGAEFENLGTTVEVIAQGGTMAINGVEFGLQQFHFHLPSEHLDNGTSRAMEMHMVWESAQGDIAVIGVYIDVENGGAAVADPAAEVPAAETTEAAAAETTAAEAAVEEPAVARRWWDKRTVASKPKKEHRKKELKKRAATTLLETVFSSVDAIAQPGSVTRTQPLIMSEIVDLIAAGDLQNYSGSLTTPPCSEGVTWFVSTQSLQISTDSFFRARDVIGFNSRFPQNQLGQPNVLAISNAMLSNLQIAGIAQRLGFAKE